MEIDIEECYKKYAPMVFRRCLKLLKNEDEALDAAQDVFVNLLRHQQRLHDRFLSSLLYTMATNTCLNRLRRHKLHGSSEKVQTLLTDISEYGSLDPQFERVEEALLMDIILQNESESTRAICFMYHIDNMNLREIGEVIGLSVSGVRKRLLAFKNRAKVKLEGEPL